MSKRSDASRCAQWKGIDAAVALPLRQAPPKIGLQTGGGLVALLGTLGEEFHRDVGDSGLREFPRALSVGAEQVVAMAVRLPIPSDRRR